MLQCGGTPQNTRPMIRLAYCGSRFRPHSDVMHAIPHINPRCMRTNYFQTRSCDCNRHAHSSLSPSVPPQLFVCHDSRSSLKDWDPVRPGDDRLMNLTNGVKGPSASTALATMLAT